jgi:UDP-N-acetylglucosamine acyltransferase
MSELGMGELAPAGANRPRIHATALVDPRAELGVGVSVGPYSIVGPEVQLGDATELGAHVVIENRVRIGRENKILHGAVIGSTPQDLKYRGAHSEVVIGDRNTIREYVTINIATDEGEQTSMGSDCLLMAYSHMAHNVKLGSNVIMANSVNLAGHVAVDDWAIVGGMCAVHQFVLIGKHSFVGGLSRLSQDVPPFVKVAGSPPIPAGINSVGMERRGFAPEQIQRVKDAYKLLYRRNLRREEALAQFRQEGEDEVYRIFEDFFARSARGIVR